MSTVRITAIAVAAAAIAAPCMNAAHSQSFEIQPGQASGPKTMAGAGDTGTIRAGGSVDASGGYGVRMLNLDQRLGNDGSIGASADGADGVVSEGDRAVIVNGGSIVLTGNGAAGVLVTGSGSSVENSGAIAVSGAGDQGIIGSGSDFTVSNSGSIAVDGDAAAGIIWQSDGLRVSNSGSVVVSGLGSLGIGAGGDDVVVDNTGLVQATGKGATGIFSAFGTGVAVNNDGSVIVSGDSVGGIVALGDSAAVTNRGAVQASGAQAVGVGVASAYATVRNTGSIFSTGADNVALSTLGVGSTVTNSGRIVSDGGAALYFGGSDATLNLLARTAVQGPIVFAGGGNTVSFGRGLSAVMTFSGTGLPETILTGGRPFVTDGDTVAVVDLAGFASAGTLVLDLTGGIAGAVDARLSDRIGGDAGHSRRAWITPFGIGRIQSGSGAVAAFDQGLGGVVAGAETDLSPGVVAGAFMGGAGGETSVEDDAQRITHRSVFGGGYLAYDTGARFTDFSLTFGGLDESSRRRVANNLVAGGVETARADYDGVFVSPSLTLGARMPYGTGTLMPSLRLRYAGLFLDGYRETGAADALSVADRDIHLFEARGQLALATQPVTTDSGVWQTTWRTGVDAVARSDGDVSASLLGQNIAFGDGAETGVLRGFVGANLSVSNGKGMTFGGDVETSYGSDGAFTASALARFSVDF